MLMPLVALTGCAPKKMPAVAPYHWVDEQTALADLRARVASLKTLSAECGITLTRADGESVQLDGALVLEPPNHVRLRAWKFNRAVFDLTLNDDGLWVMTLDDPSRREQVLPATLRAADFLRELSLFTGGFFTQDPPPKAETRGGTLLLTRDTPHGLLHCEVDRATLTPRRFYSNPRGASDERFELKLTNYREVNGLPWAMRLEATSGMGRVIVEQRDVEINGELAPQAFVPPRRAERRP
jgi:outer membrane lipoprotein-sorting protein